MSTQKPVKPPFWVLLLLVSFGSVGAVLFTPGLPAIQSFFGLTVGEAQMTITSYLIGYGLGQLPYGPLANRLGRKPTLVIGLIIAMIGSLLCALSAPLGSFPLLLFARFLQALGSCVGLKISFTMVADCYEQTAATKKISQIMISFAIMPSLAVLMGGWITQQFGWQTCFYFLILFSALMIAFSSFLPETAHALDPHALRLSSIIRGYASKLKNRTLLLCGFIMGCGTSVVYLYASKAPFIGIQLIGLDPETFGTYNLLPLIGMLTGTILTLKLAERFPVLDLLWMSSIGVLIATAGILIPFFSGALSPWALFLPMIPIYAIEGVVYANASSYGFSSAKNKSNASAMLNCINICMAFTSVLASGWIFPESPLMLPLSMFFFFSVTLVLVSLLRKKIPAQMV